jgi:hypothetical protein
MGKYNMANTNFKAPSVITQVNTFNDVLNRNSIPWKNEYNILTENYYAVTEQPIHTISGFWQEKFYTETSQLFTTGYNFEDTGLTVVGIEAFLSLQRVARIQDLVIQLTLNGDLIGENLASDINPVQSDQYSGDFTEPLNPVGDKHTYGGPTDLWGTTLSSADIANSTFGIVVSFKSNQVVPHRDLVYLDQVALRISYA